MAEPGSSDKSLLRFSQFSSFVNSSFWFKFSDLKLDEDKLEEVTRDVWGYYLPAARANILMVDCTSFNKEPDTCSSGLIAHGQHINKNTVERFRNCDKNELLSTYGEELYTRMKTGEAADDPSKLVSFVLLTFADLKKYSFHYWFAFPAICDYRYYTQESPKNLETFLHLDQIRSLAQLHKTLPENQKGFFCFITNETNIRVLPIREFIENISCFDRENAFIAFLDPTSLQDIPGWPLRNLLSLFQIHCPEIFRKPLKVVSIRGSVSNWNSRSIVFIIQLAEKVGSSEGRQFIGWEKSLKGKFSPRQVNLSEHMDPCKLSSRAVNLNLRLVKWRLQPDLNLDILKQTSCLLLGAGTLGCSVSRILLAWGIERITFVDSGTVSYSNPARQSLYTFENSCSGVEKARTAAEALKVIHPGVKAEGVMLHIATPGCSDYNLEYVNQLEELIEIHDVVFLLTDSRESRWLPTLICATKKKIAITVALGYDSYLVMRHGMESDYSKPKLGCYFCNDVVAPGNSLVDRTLDQQCTVTRPGLSNIAAAYGVELLIALLQHPDKGSAGSDEVSCLGRIPHSIRGFIADYEHMYPATRAFEHCIACSPLVMEKYREEGVNFLKNAFSSVKYLEDVTKLSQYHKIIDEIEFPDCVDDDED